MLKLKVNGQSVPKIEWKQTDGQTDGDDRITSLANAVGNKLIPLVLILAVRVLVAACVDTDERGLELSDV